MTSSALSSIRIHHLFHQPESLRMLIRVSLWLGLMGHGMVSLGMGPGYEIHLRFVEVPFH